MRKLALCCGVLAGLAFCVGGCGGGNAALPAATLTVHQGDLGSAVALHVGESVDIALDANATTGFQWHCKWTPETGLELVGDEYVPDQPIIPGSGGVQHFVLRATQAGTVTVTLQYGRWWPGGEVEDPQTLTVNVLP